VDFGPLGKPGRVHWATFGLDTFGPLTAHQTADVMLMSASF
jgi:hypothetical protein